ncbi:MAG: PAS domain S-box protein [Anaerolineae bacterium]
MQGGHEFKNVQGENLEQQDILKSATQASGALVFVFDLAEQRVSYVNDVVFRDLGYDPEYIVGLGDNIIAELTHPADTHQVYHGLQQGAQAADDERVESEFRLKNVRGEWRWYKDIVTPFKRNATGQVSHLLGVGYDITRQKQMENDLRESQGLLRSVLDAIPVRLFWKDRNSTYLGCNRLLAQDAGLKSSDAVVGLSDHDLFPGEADIYRADDQAVMESGAAKINFEEPQTTPDGKTIWLRTSKIPFQNAHGEIAGVIGAYEDITAQKEAEQALRERKLLAENFQQQLKALHETSTELAHSASLDDLYRKAVELAHQRLGFGRIGLLLMDAEQKQILGTYGTDASGNLRDERQFKRPIENDPIISEILKGKKRFGYWDDVDLWDNWEVVGHGSSAMAVIQENDQVIGWLATDNLLSGKPFSPQQIELLALYATTLGYLISTKRSEAAQRESEIRYREVQEQLIDAQKQALLELSTPIIPIIDQIIVMPLIGSIDTMRAQEITRALLRGISQHRASIVIIDITGVPVVDTGVADYLNRTIQAARLKGAHTIVTGVSDAVAETIVDLGIDWSKIDTLRDLQNGLISAFGRLGLKLNRTRA